MKIFSVQSGSIIISDPCYNRDEWCAAKVEARNGRWNSFVEYCGNRVSKLVAQHLSGGCGDKQKTYNLGVDSGQMGVFDCEKYKENESIKDCQRVADEVICEEDPWYSICCDRTLCNEQWGVIPFGVISSSGWGDGVYNVTVTFEDGEAVRVEVVFIEEKEEDQ